MIPLVIFSLSLFGGLVSTMPEARFHANNQTFLINEKPCGTVALWCKNYEAATSEEERLNALKFIHCEPVISSFFSGGSSLNDRTLLTKLYLSALKNYGKKNDYVTDLVLKGFINFKLFEHKEAGINEIIKMLSEFYNIPSSALIKACTGLKDSNAIFNLGNVGLNHSEYHSLIRKEVRDVLRN
jgi:hypothetical protein